MSKKVLDLLIVICFLIPKNLILGSETANIVDTADGDTNTHKKGPILIPIPIPRTLQEIYLISSWQEYTQVVNDSSHNEILGY